MVHLVYIVTYLGKILVIEWLTINVMIAWLCTLKKNVADNIDNKTII